MSLPSLICFSYGRISQLGLHHPVLCSFSPSFSCRPQPNLRFYVSGSGLEPVVRNLVCSTILCSSVSECRALHGRVVRFLSYRDGFIGDRLVAVYARLGCLDGAQKLFDEIPGKDLVSWNSLVSIFARRGDAGRSLNTYHRMRIEACLHPNEVTLVSLVQACTGSRALAEGDYVHGAVVKLGFLSEPKLVNSLVNMYGKVGHIDLAFRLFEGMPEPNLVSWNSVVTIHVQHGFTEEAIDLFNKMRKASVRPDQATMVILLQSCGDIGGARLAEAIHGYIIGSGHCTDLSVSTALLTFYSRSGSLTCALRVFHEINDSDCVAWTAMLAGYAMHGHGPEAIELFKHMVMKGLKPDRVTFTHLLSACAHSGYIDEGRRYFEIMKSHYGVNPLLDHYSCMVDLLGRSGHLTEAHELIKRMPIEPNSAVWGALLNACKVYKNVDLGEEVAQILFELSPSDPRNYMMLSHMYSAAGHWKHASKIRSLMKERTRIRTPGCSFIEQGSKIHRFVVADHSHPESERIYLNLDALTETIQKVSYIPKTELPHDVGLDEV